MVNPPQVSPAGVSTSRSILRRTVGGPVDVGDPQERLEIEVTVPEPASNVAFGLEDHLVVVVVEGPGHCRSASLSWTPELTSWPQIESS